MLIKPLGYRVVVKVKGVEEKSEGGIYIPTELSEREQQSQNEGILVAVGHDAFPKGNAPKLGTRVFFARYQGDVWEDEDSTYRLLSDEDIIAVIGVDNG